MNNYFIRSKNLQESFLFILPLLVLYEIGIILYGSEVKNAADVFVKSPLAVFGKDAALIFNSLVVFFSFCSLFYIEKRNRFNCRIFIPMFLESIIYAFLLGYGLLFLVYRFLPLASTGIGTKGLAGGIIISLGAGVYEEIFFRLLLLSGLCFIFIKAGRLSHFLGTFLGIAVSAAVFSAMHYIGATSDCFSTHSFLFRFMAGIILATIFAVRGLGIVVYTHAVYDVLVVLRVNT
ncbi:MAG: CPBP family intramembrane metalloprotease [Candidatus Scalindua sp.]|nr:CPBP family intramembrane metalloprotease [Candidatus Scalindua sp.]